MKLLSIMIILLISLFAFGCSSSEAPSQAQEVQTAPSPQPAPEPEPEPTPQAPPEGEEVVENVQEVDVPTEVAEKPVEPAAAQAPNGALIATTGQVPSGTTFDFTHEGQKAILVNFGGTYYAYFNRCPHSGGPSELEDDVIRCQWHGRTVEPDTGAYIAGPRSGPALQSIPVTTFDGAVYVDE